MDDPFLHSLDPGRSVFLANLLASCHCNANLRRLWGLAGWAGHSSVLILNLCINASPSAQRVGCYPRRGRGNASASLIFNLCKNTISPGSFLPSFLYLTHFLSRHYSRNSRQAAGPGAEKGEGNLSLRFLNNTWWSVTFSRMQIPNPIVNLWASQPEGCEVLSGCLRCFVLVTRRTIV